MDRELVEKNVRGIICWKYPGEYKSKVSRGFEKFDFWSIFEKNSKCITVLTQNCCLFFDWWDFRLNKHIDSREGGIIIEKYHTLNVVTPCAELFAYIFFVTFNNIQYNI